MVCISQLNAANQGQKRLQIALGKDLGKLRGPGGGNAGKMSVAFRLVLLNRVVGNSLGKLKNLFSIIYFKRGKWFQREKVEKFLSFLSSLLISSLWRCNFYVLSVLAKNNI